MYQQVVIPDMNPGSRPFNRSCNSYLNLDSRFTKRSAGYPGMTKSGFTLIELLVVVLIIGILSAVALPQYQKAVAKARIAQVLPVLKTIQEAEERFYMANGYYTRDISLLDIEVKDEHKFYIYDKQVVCYPKGSGVGISRNFEHIIADTNAPKPGKFVCNGWGSSLGASICKSLGTPVYSWTPHFTYW